MLGMPALNAAPEADCGFEIAHRRIKIDGAHVERLGDGAIGSTYGGSDGALHFITVNGTFLPPGSQPSPFATVAIAHQPCTMGIGRRPTPDCLSIGPSTYIPLRGFDGTRTKLRATFDGGVHKVDHRAVVGVNRRPTSWMSVTMMSNFAIISFLGSRLLPSQRAMGCRS